MWIQLFFDILDDEKLTKKLWNTINVNLGAKGNLKEFMFSNLSENNSNRV
jgi:hypothetical protein